MRKWLTTYILSGLCASTAVALQTSNENWVDKQHSDIQATLSSWANTLDSWIDKPDPNNPASASLRLIIDNQWHRNDGYSFKPRVRAKIRIPALKRKFSLVLGDEDLDNQSRDKQQLDRSNPKPLSQDRRYDRRQIKNDNASIALRWSEGIKALGINTDLDLGIRSKADLFVRAKASKTWQWSERFSSRFEQIYRFGVKSRHYLRSNLEQKFAETDTRFILNHTYYQYTHSTDQKKHWGNSLYRQHNYNNFKQLNYGFNFGGEVKHKLLKINYYGPFVNWRQPVLHQWLFVQPEVNFYNNKAQKRKHSVGAFLRIEALF